jgi:beta-N-acetylhexosaminidase
MSPEQKIGQMLLMGVDGQSMTEATCSLVQRLSPGGIIYRGNNASNPEQLADFSKDLQRCSADGAGIPLIIAIDHEGQYVTRFNSGVTIFPAAMAQGSTGDPELAFQVALAAGGELAYSGVNMVLGPVADVLKDYDNTVISLRSFGGDAHTVSQYVAQAVRGYLQAGIIPVLKHFPGHGGVPADTHFNVVSDPASSGDLEAEYLPPFRAGIESGAPAVMFGHVAYPAIDESALPASISPPIVNLLREDLGFQGLAMTDSMGMGAISGSTRGVASASVRAILAGEDMLMVTSPTTAQAAYDGLLDAFETGAISEERINESVRNILRIKTAWGLERGSQSEPPVPDWGTNGALSEQVGQRAVTLLRDDAGRVPLPPGPGRILIIGPTDGWGLYPVLGQALQGHGYNYYLVTYSTPWSGPIPEVGYLDTLPVQAANYDLTLMLTWDSHLNHIRYNDSWQIELVKRLLDKDIPLIVIALKSPTDILDFPDIPTYLTTAGTTKGQIHSLADVLVGINPPPGSNVLPGLVR